VTGDGRNRDADADESWTDMEEVRPDLVEALPIRHGMVLGGRYAVEAIIGRGGSGVVVRAHDRDLRQTVAIKIVRAELAGQRVWAERLAREVRLARQIHHPHVCRVFDFQQAEGRAFLVMELAERGSLREEIRSGALAARSLAARIAAARAVASALAAIHAAGIVHRDLTPQNLLRMGDGRVVVSDFGLATDASESTSVHGGTVAYMAPEVLRGGNSSFASDIWALGVVIHELVFGAKPRWSEAAAQDMLAPELGRKLTAEERAVFEACRACTVKEPGRRVAGAEEAGRLLTARRGWWARLRGRPRRPPVFAVALALVAAVAVGGVVSRVRKQSLGVKTTPAFEAPLIVPTGEPADWTDTSTVLAEIPERITCTRLLPDQRTIRFVWGSPPRAEDVDTVTRKRISSPLVPAAYAEGCPDISPDGKRLVFQGRAKDGRAFAFLSEHPDGRDAEAVVPTAEPTMSSEPTWLTDNGAFSFDIDTTHVGVFSTVERRIAALPEPANDRAVTSFRSATGGLIFVSSHWDGPEIGIVAFSWPSLSEQMRFRLTGSAAMDFRVGRGSEVYFTNPDLERLTDMVELDRKTLLARRIGSVRNQRVGKPWVLNQGLVFLSARDEADLFLLNANKALARVTHDGAVYNAAHCGDNFIVRRDRGGRSLIERIDRSGGAVGTRTDVFVGFAPECSLDGRVTYYAEPSSLAVMRCDQAGCGRLLKGPVGALAISPDGKRIAVLTLEPRGLGISWIGADGGVSHHVSETESACRPGWASAQSLWISRRRNGKMVWVEVDADSGRETGKTQAGGRDCSDGHPDPLSPVDPDLKIIYDQTSQLRLIGWDKMRRN